MTTFVVYHIESVRVVLTTENESLAKRAVTRANNKALKALGSKLFEAVTPKYAYTTREDYNQNVDILVPTYNMLGDRNHVIMIKKSQKGGCCDPATETYHSM